MSNPYLLVKIEWVDSLQPTSSWQHLDELDAPQACSVSSVGWLISEGPPYYRLAPNMGDADSDTNAQGSGIIVIPACCVTDVVPLSENSDAS